MNRMLGGYYQRASHQGRMHGRRLGNEDLLTLGGFLARVSGDIYEAHPALLGQMNQFKLVGVYDRKIQKLANSRTVQVVSSCLALALSEYEIARSRANALTRLGHEEASENPPSTASVVSLTRLRFTVLSIFAMREAARIKSNHTASYLARSLLVLTGQSVVGEGLDGCSRATLDFFVSYNPDSALLLDTAVLFEGLKRGKWNSLPLGESMISVLATSTTPEHVPTEVAISMLPKEIAIVSYAVSVLPEAKRRVLKDFLKGHLPTRRFDGLPRPILVEGLPSASLSLSGAVGFLYMVRCLS
jgi:hypothetical protein